jgi:hypothetical protein
MWKKVVIWAVLPALVVLFAYGCAPPLTPIKTEVEAPSLTRVQLLTIEDNIFKFEVYNLSDKPMVILRDEVILISTAGASHRMPGGWSNRYDVGPGQSHAVNVRFNLDHVKTGDTLKVDFSRAIMIGGAPVQIEPLPIHVD